jgi:hypothetical protein
MAFGSSSSVPSPEKLRKDLAGTSTGEGSDALGVPKIYGAEFLQTVSDIKNGLPVSVFRFINPGYHSAIRNNTHTSDTSVAIQSALDAGANPFVPYGTFVCDNIIEIDIRERLHLAYGAKLLRASASSSSTDPIVWLKGNKATLTGEGADGSLLETENRCPAGVVKIGHEDMTVSHANVNECILSGLGLFGPIDGGQTTGNPDVGIARINPFIGGLTSYFALIKNLRISSLNIAIQWLGDSNADRVGFIHAQNIGNATLSAHRVMFDIAGAADNNMMASFFHQSTNSTMIRIRDYDNTANPGGKNHNSPSANMLNGMVGEQGGTGVWLEATDASCSGSRNVINGIDNGGGAIGWESGFEQRNTINNSDGSWQKRRVQISADSGDSNTWLKIVADKPEIVLNEQDANANEKQWELYAENGQLIGRIVNDAYSSAANFLEVNRTGASVDDISLSTGGSGNKVLRVDTDGTAGNMRLEIYDNSAGGLARVSRGSVDSGGSGYRLLRVPN